MTCKLSAGKPDEPTRQRIHVERMLARAERRSRQATKLVEKWKSRLAEVDRAGVAARQAELWSEEHLEESFGKIETASQAAGVV
jgi:hypothetical protein